MKFSADFLAGFRAAISAIGHEGDYRRADWSEPYEWLKKQYAEYEQEPPKELFGVKIVINPELPPDSLEFHHPDGRVDRFKLT